MATELTWISFLHKDHHIPQLSSPTVYCDNLSALQLTNNPMLHARSKHIEIDYHYVKEQVALTKLHTKHVNSYDQLAKVFTMAFYLKICSSLPFYQCLA